MKKKFLFLYILIFSSAVVFSQQHKVFDAGEFFKFKLSYGFINAGVATLELKESNIDKNILHAVGYGYTVGITKVLFKVEDDYQSYFDKNTNKTARFIRKIDEGGYTMNQEGFFNHPEKNILVKDYKNNVENIYSITENVQDILSSFYYLRNHPKIKNIRKGDFLEIDMFFDGEVFKFKLKYNGNENIKTKFGKIEAMSFTPYVMTGRVFKEKESLTVWVSADENKAPLRVKASLLVGSLKADLEEYRGLKSELKVNKE